jgi:hypothetical protein
MILAAWAMDAARSIAPKAQPLMSFGSVIRVWSLKNLNLFIEEPVVWVVISCSVDNAFCQLFLPGAERRLFQQSSAGECPFVMSQNKEEATSENH